MKQFLAILYFIFLSQFSFGQDEMGTRIIYGKDHAFSLTAPDGWVFDSKAGVNQGIHAVFYKEGETWADAETVMYVNTSSLDNEDIGQLIRYDLSNFYKNYSDLKVEDAQPIQIDNKTTAIVKYLSGESYGNYEAIAYIDAGKTGVMIILSSRSKGGFENSLSDFETLVKSYFLLAMEVEYKKN